MLRHVLVALAAAIAWHVRAADEAPVPLQVKAPRTAEPLRMDGLLAEEAWGRAAAVPVHFADKFAGVPQADVGMTVKVVWDDYYLYIGYEVLDADVRASGNGEIQGPENNRREGIQADPNLDNDFVEFFLSFGDRNFFWEIHHDAANHFNDVWCTVPDKAWPLHGSTMHMWGIHFAHREYIEDDGPFELAKAVWLRLGEKRARSIVNDNADPDVGWSGEIRLPWRGIGAPKAAQSWLKPDPGNPHFRIPGPWRMAGRQLNLLAVVHRGELPERYYHSSPTRKGDWFHFTFDHWPVYTFTE